jgi:hypothetical protein
MSVYGAEDQAEQEAADQAEERRVAREDKLWEEAQLAEAHESDLWPPRQVPPYLFADERSQRRVEEEARQERPLDDYDTWTDQNERLFR